jgi:hypothetical protein
MLTASRLFDDRPHLSLTPDDGMNKSAIIHAAAYGAASTIALSAVKVATSCSLGGAGVGDFGSHIRQGVDGDMVEIIFEMPMRPDRSSQFPVNCDAYSKV